VLLPENGCPCNLSRPETVVMVALALGVEEKEDLILGAGKEQKKAPSHLFKLYARKLQGTQRDYLRV
jgi:hypothetical protein